MYRLLLVSDREEVRALYERYAEWENLGFERPVIASNAQEGIKQLSKGRFDAVSSLLSVGEGKKFFSCLSRRPELLGMETARDESRLRQEISNARRMLASRDIRCQKKQVDDLIRAMQVEFFSDLLRGTPYEAEKIDERVQSLKLAGYDPGHPVVTASFRLPQGDYFLSEVWRYGRERLENALKNIFETGSEDVFYVLLIINPHHMRLIALPRRAMTREQLYEEMVAQLSRCQANLEEYFELTLNVKRVVQYDSLYALGQENAMRTAH